MSYQGTGLGIGLRTGVIALSVTFAGCYVEEREDRAAAGGRGGQGPVATDDARDGDSALCRTTLAKGCFDGHVLSKKKFLIDGKPFFDADDLANRFKKELVAVRSNDLQLDPAEYELTFGTRVDNASFLQEFEYYATGVVARSGKVRSDGNFTVNEMHEGVYDLRVQRAVKFTLTRKVAAVPVEPVTPVTPVDGEPVDDEPVRDPTDVAPVEPTVVTRNFCAKIYAEQTLDVRPGERLNDTFGAFKLFVTDDTCEGGSSGATLTL